MYTYPILSQPPLPSSFHTTLSRVPCAAQWALLVIHFENSHMYTTFPNSPNYPSQSFPTQPPTPQVSLFSKSVNPFPGVSDDSKFIYNSMMSPSARIQPSCPALWMTQLKWNADILAFSQQRVARLVRICRPGQLGNFHSLNSIQSFEMSFTIMCHTLNHKNISWNEHQGHTWTLESLISLLLFPRFSTALISLTHYIISLFVMFISISLPLLAYHLHEGRILVGFIYWWNPRVPITVSGIL